MDRKAKECMGEKPGPIAGAGMHVHCAGQRTHKDLRFGSFHKSHVYRVGWVGPEPRLTVMDANYSYNIANTRQDTSPNLLKSTTHLVPLLMWNGSVFHPRRWRVSTGSALDFISPLMEAGVVNDLVAVTGEETARSWWMILGDSWMSFSRDCSFKCSDLVKCLPRDLMNEAAFADDRFNQATEGMFIVYDLLLEVDGADVI